MAEPPHRTGTIQSGGVPLFYRAFGSASSSDERTPLIILHGSNYFDSYDWIQVASGLGKDRQVAAFDHRGFGLSGWSEDKDYSLDALLSDIRNVSAHFGWARPAIMGHSMSGRLGIFFAAYYPEHVSHLIVLDSAMGNGNPGQYKISVGNASKIYETVEAAMASLADRASPPRFALDRKRAELALRKVAGGFSLKRDPDHRNTQSQAPGAPLPRLKDLDVWKALGDITCPVAFVRGQRSDRNKPEYYDRLARDFPEVRVETVDSRHDVAFEAPDELTSLVRRIIQ